MADFDIIDNAAGGYRAVLRSDPSKFVDADTYGLAEAQGAELVQNMAIEARNAVYEKIDEERLLEEANAVARRRRKRAVLVDDTTPDAPPDPAPAAAPSEPSSDASSAATDGAADAAEAADAKAAK